MAGAYKEAKEAFVADNLGSSLWSIQLVSVTALSAYALYSVWCRRSRGLALDYFTVVFPLLLSVTLLSGSPYLLNMLLLSLIGIGYFTSPAAHVKERDPVKVSQGKWLEESDSDEEPSEPVRGSGVSLSTPTLTSRHARSRAPQPPANPLLSPTNTASPTLDKPDQADRIFKRRHSPTPSTHTHTAIDVLPTPENATFTIPPRPDYPSNPRNLTGQSKAQLPFLTVYRAHMMIMTVHCILAVDFPVFPRYFGKCENFGSSLMDVGVGSFVFSLGIVSRVSASRSSLPRQVLVALRKASPVLLLGIVRVLMVKGTEYPEHVTEYGVHWNFFFTLGFLPVLGILLEPLHGIFGWTPLALAAAAVHQMALKLFGLQAWVMSPTRAGLMGKNKEGVVSLPGYLAIYFLGQGIGQRILKTPYDDINDTPRNQARNEEQRRMKADKRRSECAMELFGYTIGWWILLLVCTVSGLEISRRLANLSYVLWTTAYNTTFLWGYLLIEMAFFPSFSGGNSDLPNPVPPLLDAVNKNGLVFFLLANLATGLVNVSLRTMYVPDGPAFWVLTLYSMALCGIAWVLRRYKLRI